MRRSRGFTLLELMMVIVIIGVLAGIAFPAYNQYIIKATRSAAKSFISQIASQEESYLINNRTYTTTISGGGLNLTQPSETNNKYTFSVSQGTTTAACTAIKAGFAPPCYRITATAINGQLSDGNLVLDSDGAKQGHW